LLLDGENTGKDALRHAEDLVISNEQFETFLERHKNIESLVPENNSSMQDSYLLLDEEMRYIKDYLALAL
jgi:radical S-adenosyl methionine domain-containing protein 2